MDITVRLFAGLRERAGTGSLTVALADGARVADALAAVAELTGDAVLVTAVNREYADAQRPLRAGDELALIPPVSGGAGTRVHVRVTDEPLSLDALLARVRDPRAGAVVTFSGVTRDVAYLDYEAYAEMAHAEIERIVRRAVSDHGLCAAAAEHTVGRVARGVPSVLIAVSAPHRAEAFAGAREVIDRIKERAPIWKKEAGEWASGSLPAADHPNG